MTTKAPATTTTTEATKTNELQKDVLEEDDEFEEFEDGNCLYFHLNEFDVIC
jgi:hypothetical protein